MGQWAACASRQSLKPIDMTIAVDWGIKQDIIYNKQKAVVKNNVCKLNLPLYFCH